MLKILLDQKISLIPLLFHENRFETFVFQKTELFNYFLSNQCSLLSNCSKLLINPRYVTYKRLRTIDFTADNIEKLILIQTKPIVMTTAVYVC